MKIGFQTVFIIFILVYFTNTNAQVFYVDDKSGEEYEINQNTDKKILKNFLKEQKATDIEFNPNPSPEFPFRLKNKKGNWALFHSGLENLLMEKENKKYSFQFPTSVMERSGFTLANSKGKIYFINLFDNEVETKMHFDEVVVIKKKDTLYNYSHSYDENANLTYTENESIAKVIDKIAVKKADKWGLVEFADGEIYLSRDFLYKSPEEVPTATGFQSYQLEMMENLRKDQNVDLLVALDENGYYFKARNKKTKLYGIYASEGIAFNQIPTKYTNIIRHRSPETFEVWKDGKVGYYNGNYKLVFEPLFDDFKFVHLDYTYGCALKKHGKWELYKANEPIKLVEGSATTVNELIDLWLDR